MPRVMEDHCDRCGAVRKKDNNWLVRMMNDESFILSRLEDLDKSRIGIGDNRILCGAQCAAAEQSEWIADEKR